MSRSCFCVSMYLGTLRQLGKLCVQASLLHIHSDVKKPEMEGIVPIVSTESLYFTDEHDQLREKLPNPKAASELQICGLQSFLVLLIIGPGPCFHFDSPPRSDHPPRPVPPVIERGDTMFAPRQLANAHSRPSGGERVVEQWLLIGGFEHLGTS